MAVYSAIAMMKEAKVGEKEKGSGRKVRSAFCLWEEEWAEHDGKVLARCYKEREQVARLVAMGEVCGRVVRRRWGEVRKEEGEVKGEEEKAVTEAEVLEAVPVFERVEDAIEPGEFESVEEMVRETSFWYAAEVVYLFRDGAWLAYVTGGPRYEPARWKRVVGE